MLINIRIHAALVKHAAGINAYTERMKIFLNIATVRGIILSQEGLKNA